MASEKPQLQRLRKPAGGALGVGTLLLLTGTLPLLGPGAVTAPRLAMTAVCGGLGAALMRYGWPRAGVEQREAASPAHGAGLTAIIGGVLTGLFWAYQAITRAADGHPVSALSVTLFVVSTVAIIGTGLVVRLRLRSATSGQPPTSR